MPQNLDWLVQTKLQPPFLHTGTIERQRLLEALQAAVVAHPLTLISAPAGYGKTTLLAALPRLLPEMQIAWLTLDTDDNDPARFLGGLLSALQRLNPDFGAGVGQQLATDPRRVMILLINEIMEHLHGPLALVLDDLHFITDPRIYAALDFFIERLPQQLRLVIGTRHDPPLALARLIARRQVAEIRRAHLSFTAEEADRLLNDALGMQMDRESVGQLTARTEGWAAGLCLLASSLDRIRTDAGRAALLDSLARTDLYVFDFLAAEVLNHQEPEVRTFLLQTSILAELTPVLCEAVTGRADAGLLLEDLYHKNLFLVADAFRSFRYHALFGEFLRRQLEQEHPQMVTALHSRAADAHPSRIRAIGHLLAAGLFEEAAQAMEQFGDQFLGTGLAETLRRWGGSIPVAVQEHHPRLSFLLGRAAIHQGDYRMARSLVTRAQEGFARQGLGESQAVALSVLCSVAMLLGDTEGCRVSADQLLALPGLPAGLMARAQSTVVYLKSYEQDWEGVATALGKSLSHPQETGDLAAAAEISFRYGPWLLSVPGCLAPVERFCQWAASDVPSDHLPLRLAVGDLRAAAELIRGQLADAVATAEATLAVKKRLGGYTWLGLSCAAVLATVSAAQGDEEASIRQADTLLMFTDTAALEQMQFWLYVVARTYWLAGRVAEARRLLLRMKDPATPKGLAMGPALQRRLAGLIALSDGRPAEAEAAFREAVLLENGFPLGPTAGTARVPLMRALMAQNRGAEALAELNALLAECTRSGMPGLIIQEGTLIRPLLRQAARSANPGHGFAEHLLSLLGETVVPVPAPAMPTSPPLPEPLRAPLVESLTERELEVLRRLSGGATNREIAESLIIGEETVKTHVARILRKLEAPTRSRAVTRGRELGLI